MRAMCDSAFRFWRLRPGRQLVRLHLVHYASSRLLMAPAYVILRGGRRARMQDRYVRVRRIQSVAGDCRGMVPKIVDFRGHGS